MFFLAYPYLPRLGHRFVLDLIDQVGRVLAFERHAIDFALRLMEISPRRKQAMTHFWSIDDILLTVGPSQGAGGHSTHRNAHEEAADWLLRRVGH